MSKYWDNSVAACVACDNSCAECTSSDETACTSCCDNATCHRTS